MNDNLIDEAAVAAALTFKNEITDFAELETISIKVKAVLEKHFAENAAIIYKIVQEPERRVFLQNEHRETE